MLPTSISQSIPTNAMTYQIADDLSACASLPSVTRSSFDDDISLHDFINDPFASHVSVSETLSLLFDIFSSVLFLVLEIDGFSSLSDLLHYRQDVSCHVFHMVPFLICHCLG